MTCIQKKIRKIAKWVEIEHAVYKLAIFANRTAKSGSFKAKGKCLSKS